MEFHDTEFEALSKMSLTPDERERLGVEYE